MVFNRINLEDDEPLVQQVQLFVGIEQVVILSALVVRLQHIEESGKVEVFLPHFLFLQLGAVLRPDKFVERIERRLDALILPDTVDIEGDGIGECDLFRTGGRLVVFLPQREQQGLDALPFFDVEHLVFREEGVERDGIFIRIGIIDTVLAVCLAVDHFTQALIAVTRIHDDDVRALLVVLPHEVVHEKGLAATAWAQHKFVSIGRNTPFHRQVADVQMERFARQPVHHLHSERRHRIPVVGLLRKEAYRLLDEGVEALLRGEVRLIAGNTCPEQGRAVHRIVAWRTLHRSELAARVVLDAFQLVGILAPRYHIEMRTDGGQTERVRLVQILVYPLLVDGVASGVPRKRLHIAGGLLEAFQILVAVVDEDILVIQVVARQEQTERTGERETAIAPVGGQPLVTTVRGDLRRHIVHIREGMQAETLVPDAHFISGESDVLQAGCLLRGEREVLLDQSRLLPRSRNLVIREAAQADKAGIVHNPCELVCRFKEFQYGVLVADFLRDDEAPAQRVEVALPATALFGGLRQEQVTPMVKERTLVEVPLETAAQKAHLLLLKLRFVTLLDKPVLLVYDAEVRQHLDCLAPRPVYGFVLRCGHGVDFGERHLESDRDVRILRHDAAVLHAHQRKLALQRGGFHYVSHIVVSFLFLRVNNRDTAFRLMM
ncbi:predicted protein [Eggerthella sp. CAG:1427]|nr:predicted protein [Eggerthella sp. CAG:1427]